MKDKSKLFMLTGICILVIAIFGSTYALYKYALYSDLSVNTITRGLDYYINYTEGTSITNEAILPGSDYTSGNSTSVTLYKKDNTYTIYGHIYLDITSIGSNISKSNALRYVVLDGDTVISKGALGGVTSGSKVLLAHNLKLTTVQKSYTIYLWLDENEDLESEAENETVNASIRCEASMKEIEGENYNSKSFSQKIIKLYNSGTKSPVENNSITYQYDTAHNLMKDIGGNIRYYGSSPDNYLYFNCDDYSNQSDSTCEKWRIIGIVDGKIKIMRNSTIGSYSWDNKNISSGAETNNGKNEWTDARLMKLLNPGYENEENGGSLYYNAGSGFCYSGQNNATKACDFAMSGLKNDTTRNLVSESTWYFLGWNDPTLFSDQMYEYERTKGKVYNTSIRKTTWKGKVTLPYASDYGYAADFNRCTQFPGVYNNDACKENNWMVNIITNYGNSSGWVATPVSYDSSSVWIVFSSGHVEYWTYSYDSEAVVPTLYLAFEQEIGIGTGTESDPYRLSV